MTQVAVFLIVNKEGKVLVEQRIEDEIVELAGQFLFPGGGAREGEDLEKALLREIEEELGIKPLEYLRLLENEEIKGIAGDVSLNPFYISQYEGEIPKKILDEKDLLTWVELDFMLHSSLEPTRKIARILKNHLDSMK